MRRHRPPSFDSVAIFSIASLAIAFTLAADSARPAPRLPFLSASPTSDELQGPAPHEDGPRGSGGRGKGGLEWAQTARLISSGISYGRSLPLFAGGPPGRGPWLPFGPPLGPHDPVLEFRAEAIPPLLSDGEFVWGPNVGRFDAQGFLHSLGSPLEPYAADLEIWALYSSVSPRVLLTVLELRHGVVRGDGASFTEEEVLAAIEDTAMSLAEAFYDHLHTWGRRASARPDIDPMVRFADGTAATVGAASSGTYAVAAGLAPGAAIGRWREQLSPDFDTGFSAVYGSLFPGSDPLGTANEITPSSAPPDVLLQFPFPMGAVWGYAGPHSWNGGNSPPPFSSLDFYAGGATCSAPPGLFTVAAAGGTPYRPYDYRCWLEIDHGAGWTTSYYHLRNLFSGSGISRNNKIGTIGCELCAGGFGTGPHVHFSLKYNGAYVSLEGVRLSGWTVHVGPVAYYTGWLERDGQSVPPFNTLVNDYHLYYGVGDFSVRTYGNGSGDIDRLKIRMSDTNTSSTGPPADVGGQDFSLEWWMKSLPDENVSPAVSCGSNINWIYGNTVLDRDRYNQDRKYGVSLAGGRVVFGVSGNGTGDLTICGATDVRDGAWHHVAVERRFSDGFMWLFVDGVLEASADGPDGDISYPEDAVPGSYCGPSGDQPCVNDPFLVLGAEKHDAGPQYPSFAGWIDELRISNLVRYEVDFTPPAAAFAPDAGTLVLIHFDEGSGTQAYDVAGSWGGPSNATLRYGGSPAGPEWSSDTPFRPPDPIPTATATSTHTATATSTYTPTSTATPTSTPTSTRTPTATATATHTATPTASRTPTRTATATHTVTPTATSSRTPTSAPSPSSTPSPTQAAAPSATTTPTGVPALTHTPTPAPSATPNGDAQAGDLNLDGVIDVLDLQLCVNVVLAIETSPDIVARADLNQDGEVNVLDVQALVNIILGT